MQARIVIPTWDGWRLLDRCLDAIPRDLHSQVIVVDNGSVDGTSRLLRQKYEGVTLIPLSMNTGFAHAVNRGIEASAPHDVILLNNDAFVEPGFFSELDLAVKTSPSSVGFFQAKLLRSGGEYLDSAGDDQTWLGQPQSRGHREIDAGQWDQKLSIGSACGGAAWYRRTMLDDIGLLYEPYFAYYEDVDLCLRATLRGWTGLFVPKARVQHVSSASSQRMPGFKRFQTTRNGWWLLLRTTPASLLPRILPRFILLQLFLLASAVKDREVGAALRGHVAALRNMPTTLIERRAIQASRNIEPAQYWQQLRRATVTHTIGSAVERRLGRLRRRAAS